MLVLITMGANAESDEIPNVMVLGERLNRVVRCIDDDDARLIVLLLDTRQRQNIAEFITHPSLLDGTLNRNFASHLGLVAKME